MMDAIGSKILIGAVVGMSERTIARYDTPTMARKAKAQRHLSTFIVGLPGTMEVKSKCCAEKLR